MLAKRPKACEIAGMANALFQMVRILLVAFALAATFVSPAAAQESDEEGNASGDNRQITTLPPAYDDQMMRLGEILGSLHYLRALCGADEEQLWRDEMQKLIEAEEPSDQRRAQLIASFNRGFRGYQEIYRECTPPASEAANRFLEQGVRISADIPNRYGR